MRKNGGKFLESLQIAQERNLRRFGKNYTDVQRSSNEMSRASKKKILTKIYDILQSTTTDIQHKQAKNPGEVCG